MFKFKGISSSQMGIIVEEEENLIARASQKIEQIDIEGKNGSIYNVLGYSDIERPLKLYVRDKSKIDEILSWLNGEGILEYNDRITTACFYSQIEPIRSSSIQTIECSLIRSPFWYKKNDDYIVITNVINNLGNTQSKPIIRLEKNASNSIDMSIGNIRFVYNFDEDDYVEIDCDECNAKYENMLKNRNLEIDFDFPILNPGVNNITIYNGDATVKVKRKDCWL